MFTREKIFSQKNRRVNIYLVHAELKWEKVIAPYFLFFAFSGKIVVDIIDCLEKGKG